jgi:hypothetical protein
VEESTTLIHHRREPTVHMHGRQGAVGLPEMGVRDRVPRSRPTNRMRCQRDGKLRGRLEVARGGVPLPAGETAMQAYSWDDGVLRRTPWITQPTSTRSARRRDGRPRRSSDGRRSAPLGSRSRALMTTNVGLMSATFGEPEVIA